MAYLMFNIKPWDGVGGANDTFRPLGGISPSLEAVTGDLSFSLLYFTAFSILRIFPCNFFTVSYPLPLRALPVQPLRPLLVSFDPETLASPGVAAPASAEPLASPGAAAPASAEPPASVSTSHPKGAGKYHPVPTF